MQTDHEELARRTASIGAIERDLLAMGNDRQRVKSMAKSARKLKVGQAVESTTHNVRGVIGYAVTETLCVGITSPDNLSGARFFADPLNLRALKEAK